MENLVFICHSSVDADLSNKIVIELEKAGISAWIAPRNIRSGTTYAAAIVQAIKRCNHLIFVFSKSSNRSDSVVNEIENANALKKPIIPFKIDNEDYSDSLDYYLRTKQSINAYSRSTEQAIAELINTIGGSVQVPVTEAAPRPSSKKKGAIFFVIGLVIAVIAGFIILNKPRRSNPPENKEPLGVSTDMGTDNQSKEPAKDQPVVKTRTAASNTFLTGTWQLEWGNSDGKAIESVVITYDSRYFVNGTHAFDIVDYSYDPGSEQITFTKKSVIDSRILVNTVTIKSDKLLVGTESNYGVTYTRLSD